MSETFEKIKSSILKNKYFPKLLMGIGLILLIISLILFDKTNNIKSDLVLNNEKMNKQIQLIENLLENKNVNDLKDVINDMFSNSSDNQLTFVEIIESSSKENREKVIIKYPKEIEEEYYFNSFSKEIQVNDDIYVLKYGAKNSSNYNNSDVFKILGIVILILSWLILGIWSIIKINKIRRGGINNFWIIFSLITSLFAYFICLLSIKFKKDKV